MKCIVRQISILVFITFFFLHHTVALASEIPLINGSLEEKINAMKNSIPRFFEIYCTKDSSAEMMKALTAMDTALKGNEKDDYVITSLIHSLSEGMAQLKYISDRTIPQIYLATDDGTGNSFGTSLDKSHGYVAAQITVVNEQGRIVASDTGWKGMIRVRGNTTAQGEKKAYNIKFSAKKNLFGMGKAKKWVLLADLYDPTYMRNVLALDFGKTLGLSSTPDFKRVEVWMDGVYRGLYLLTEKIEAHKHRVNISKDTGTDDFLVEMVFPGIQEEETDHTFLLTSSEKCFRLREPEEVSTEKIKEITDSLNHLEAVLESGDWNQVSAIIDLDSFVSCYLQNEFFKTIDFSDTSVYFYRKNGRYYGGPGWDFDLSAGNCNPEIYGDSFQSYDGSIAIHAHYYGHLMTYPEFRLAVLKKYLAVKEYIHNIYADGGKLDEQLQKYAEPILRNNTVWFRGAESYIKWQRTPDESYEENIAYLRNWMKQRDLWLSNFLTTQVASNSEDS